MSMIMLSTVTEVLVKCYSMKWNYWLENKDKDVR